MVNENNFIVRTEEASVWILRPKMTVDVFLM